MTGLSEILGPVLIVLTLTKLIATSNAIRWVLLHGSQYRRDVDRLLDQRPEEELTDADFVVIFEANAGRFFPFGVKDYLARDRISKIAHNQRRLLRLCGRILDLCRWLAFRYMNLVILSSIYICVVGLFNYGPGKASLYNIWIVRILALTIYTTTIAIVVEFVYGTIVFQDYTKYFHLIDYIKRIRRMSPHFSTSKLTTIFGIRRLGEVIFCVLLSGSAYVFYGSLVSGDFNACPKEGCPRDVHGIGLGAIRSAYYATTTVTTTGYGDITPTRPWGYIVAICVQIQTFFILTFAAAVFWSVDPTDQKRS